MREEATLSIGEVATRAGVSVSAIRFYERRGLLPEPDRAGGRRRYAPAIIGRLEIVAAGKRAGLSLAEIGALLAADDEGAPAGQGMRALAACKLPEVETLIERAEATRGWLSLAAECGCETLSNCALLAAR